ncbi:aminopeptidase P family N-terminal domain-containing protein [Bradyrhizobium sp. Arg816]|uniref:aminopeptidase P family N-terminal domain-containing protein n=1 Tax=Bradyrhizobium sp. Arg816 TaxID=2998491 RepID=UPI00249F3D80|nr:aminopeptidase P family N-terminal domain-containing protein [Bradyrhizobium sp. Arg816]MDI3567182.1 aminopeptidase P family N-terminal domain-containing protein [Bradyrhizobium sp. Arg816]
MQGALAAKTGSGGYSATVRLAREVVVNRGGGPAHSRPGGIKPSSIRRRYHVRIRSAGISRAYGSAAPTNGGAGYGPLLVFNEANMNYLTGYDGYSDYVPQLALVCQDEEDPWLILREMDVACATATSYLPHSRHLGYPEQFIGSAHQTPWQSIGHMVRKRTKSNRIVIELTAKNYGVKAQAT